MSIVDRIGRYTVERRLGSGAFALVWLGHDEVLDAPVAIKVLAENWAYQLDLRARFVEEARVLRRADSDRVVRVFDIGDLPDGRPYFVMTYADRGTLEERLAGGARLPVAEGLRVAEQVARGVAVVHGLGVIHRDLKPSNVLFRSTVDGRERLLIADLGLSKALAYASGFTVAAGSPGYMAPEQRIVGGGIDVRVDVYGIGAIAYRVLTGVVPKCGAGGAEPPSALRDGLPEGTDSVLSRALEVDRERRWPSARSLADALAELADRVPPEAVEDADDDEPTVVDGAIQPAPEEADAPAGAASGPAPVRAAAAETGPAADSRSAVLASLTGRDRQPDPEPTAVLTGPAAEPRAPTPAATTVQPSGRRSSPTTATHPPGGIPRPAPARRRRRWPWPIALVTALGLVAVGAAVVLTRDKPTTTTVQDRSGAISVTVPVAWGRQVQDEGWSPKAAGLGTETSAAGLAVATDLTDWRDPAKAAPGVFVGVSGDAALVGRVGQIQHAGCTRTSARYGGGGFTGTVFRHACPGAASFAEVGLTGPGSRVRVYVQIKQPSGEDHTAQILASLRVRTG